MPTALQKKINLIYHHQRENQFLIYLHMNKDEQIEPRICYEKYVVSVLFWYFM